MPALPKILKLIIFIFLLTLFSIPSSASAQTPVAPDPQPCAFPKDAKDLSENPIIAEDGEAPIILNYSLRNVQAQTIPVSNEKYIPLESKDFPFLVDFSKLQAVFAPENSDFGGGKFQDPAHQLSDITSFNGEDLNNYHGPAQKLSDKILIDDLKIKYINYVSSEAGHNLPEAETQISDIKGGDPRTIFQMVTDFGHPKPVGETQDPNTWGRYWEKIPTSYSEFHKGFINFKSAVGQKDIKRLEQGQCLFQSYKINITLPEHFRTAHISDQLNRLIVPLDTQRDKCHRILNPELDPNDPRCKEVQTSSIDSGNIFAATIDLCKNLLTKTSEGLAKNLGKIIQITMERLDLIRPAFAEVVPENSTCIITSKDPKAGQAPYCPFPPGEIDRINQIDGMNVRCDNPYKNIVDNNKLEEGNDNVVCTFTLRWPGLSTEGGNEMPILNRYPVPGPDCTLIQGTSDRYDCDITVRIWPIFNLPWTAEAWNNLSYSDKKNPGVYSYFIPNSLIGGKYLPGLKQPGQTQGASANDDPKTRGVGTVNCSKQTVNISLTPVDQQDPTLRSAGCSDFGQSAPGSHPVTADNCGGKYALNNPLGNFGDPACDFSFELMSQMVQAEDPANFSTWLTIIAGESSYGPNAYRPHQQAGADDTPDTAGAWGLFQMGRGKNGTFDHGDVPWRVQITNAINYNKSITPFCYWQVARKSGIAKGC
ncbi:MAG: hypothetical protein NUV69_03435 [Candidatus Curtissbacteria bacterium]|nr:hypothetical protein [Candidatus Curtissbacteria bacterium]